MGLLAAETGVRLLLVNDSGVSALVSSRVYPGQAPEGAAFPLVVYDRPEEVGHSNMGGGAGLVEFELMLVAYGYTLAEAQAVGAAMKAKLNGYKGAVSSGSDSVEFDSILFARGRDVDLEVVAPDGTKGPLFGRESVYRVFSYEA